MNQIDRKTLHLVFRAIRQSFKQSEKYSSIKALNESIDVGVRGGKRWFCALCGQTTTEVELDHYPEPVIAIGRRWYDYTVDEMYQNVFSLPCRVLCKNCHKTETRAQNLLRKKAK